MRIFVMMLFLLGVRGALALDYFDYHPGELLIQHGPLKGQSLKSDRRPVLRISERQRKDLGLPDLGSRILWVANFTDKPAAMKDKQKFHIAAIPLDGIAGAMEEIMDRTAYNPSGNGLWQQLASVAPHFHAQTYFIFNRGVALYSQEIDPQTGFLASVRPVQEIHEMAFAVGAARPETFDPSLAIGGAYRRISLLVGRSDAHRDLVAGVPITRYKLGLSRQKLAELLVMLSDDSTRVRVSRSYDAMKDGCLSTTLGYLDKILFDEPVHRFPYSWPHGPESVMAEFAIRGIAYEKTDPILPDSKKFRPLKEKGEYGPARWHHYSIVSHTVGHCGAIMSRLVTRVSLRLPGVR